MNNSISANKKQDEKTYFLSELLGAKVIAKGKIIGKLYHFPIIIIEVVQQTSAV